jgi:DHA1 family bicyclomycin/chloramphenicol resistance-like MFS transporter
MSTDEALKPKLSGSSAASSNSADQSIALSRVGERWMLAALGFYMTVSPAATDMYLPALKVVAQDLQASGAQVQMTVSSFFLGFGLGQMIWGPLADRFGRKTPLLAGLALFVVAGFAAAMARTIDQMLTVRFLQALGASAMPVIAQAIARDVWGKSRSAQALSMMMLMMGIGPLIAPLIGAQILKLAHWQAIFWVLAGLGALGLLITGGLPETRPLAARAGITARVIAASYLELLRDRRYLGYALTSTAVWAQLYVYVAGAPLAYIGHFGLSPHLFSIVFATNIVGLISVNYLNAFLLRMRQPPDKMLRIGIVSCAVVNLIMALLAYLGTLPWQVMAALLFVFVSLRGFVNANAAAGAMANHSQRAASAAALMGAVQCGVGFAAGAVMSALSDGSPRPMLLVMAVLSIAALVSMTTLLRSRAEIIEVEV